MKLEKFIRYVSHLDCTKEIVKFIGWVEKEHPEVWKEYKERKL